MVIQESGEMYLETILILSQSESYVRAVDISEAMGFSKPSVSRALSLLKGDGYIEVSDSGHITLTEGGKAIAERIYERHKTLTKCLMSLGVSEDQAVRDACKIEHDISEESFNAVRNHLKDCNDDKI